MPANKTLFVFFLVVFLGFSELQGQNWTHAARFSSLGNDYLTTSSIAYGPDGSMYLAGNFQNAANFDTVNITAPVPNRNYGFLLKFNAFSQPIWARVFPQKTYDVTVDATGAVFVAGSVWSWTSQDDSLAFVAKYSSDGNLLATFSASGTADTWAKVVRTDAVGNCYIAGERFSAGLAVFGNVNMANVSSRQCFMVKLNPGLSQVSWAVYTGESPNLDNIYDLEIDPNGFVYTAGNYSQNYEPPFFGCGCYNGDFYVEKHLATTGASVWKKIFSGGSGDDTKQFVQLDPDGQSLSVAACFKKTTTFDPFISLTANTNLDYHLYLAKINTSDATVQWAKKLSTSGDAFLWRMARKNNNIWLHGFLEKPTTMGSFPLNIAGVDAFFAQVDASDGNVLQAEKLYGSGNEFGYGLAVLDTQVVVSGISSSVGTNLTIGNFQLQGNTNSIYVARKGGPLQLPPIADFEANTTMICASDTVVFQNTSSQSPSLLLWQFPGGTPSSSTAANPVVVYNTAGIYAVSLQASNGAGADTLVKTGYIQVSAAPMTSFTSSVSGLVLSFSNTSTNANTYLWDFGDGQSSSQQSPSHTYADCGTYTVTLTSTNACGTTSSTATVVAGNGLPTAGFTQSVNGLMVTFSNTSTNANTYLWDFGDGQSSSLQSPSHTYADCGTYTVTLTSTNACGTTSSTASVVAGNGLPTAGFTQSVNGLMVAFSNTSTNANTYSWDFGDGQSSSQQSPSHTYADCGTYTVTLTGTNACGTTSSTASVVAGNGLPTAGFTQSVNGVMVAFSNTSTNANIYLWDFGDGQSSTETSPEHNYDNCGIFTVVLTISNACGTASSTAQVTIINLPISSFSSSVDGLTVTVQNNATGGTTYFWNFGDGQTSALQDPPPHTYADSGTYVITLVVSNGCGASVFQETVTTVSCPTAGYVSTSNGLVVQFQNQSEGADSYHWDFGDGQSSTLEHPVHTYTDPGVYTVLLTVENACGLASFSSTITVMSVGVVYPTWLESVQVYPVPAVSKCTVWLVGNSPENVELILFNTKGQALMHEYKHFQSGILSHQFNTEDLPRGMYQLLIRSNGQQMLLKIVTQ